MVDATEEWRRFTENTAVNHWRDEEKKKRSFKTCPPAISTFIRCVATPHRVRIPLTRFKSLAREEPEDEASVGAKMPETR